MKFKMIASCVAVGMGLASAGAHAEIKVCEPKEEIVTVIAALNIASYKIKRYMMGYGTNCQLPSGNVRIDVSTDNKYQYGLISSYLYFDGTTNPFADYGAFAVDVIKIKLNDRKITYHKRVKFNTSPGESRNIELLPFRFTNEAARVIATAPHKCIQGVEDLCSFRPPKFTFRTGKDISK